jgi:hypothetical protein
VLVGVGPGPLPGVEAFLDATLSGAGVAPSLRAGLRHAERAGFHEPEGSAAFQLTTLWAETCPLQLLKSKTTALRPCFGAQYGVLEASGSQVADAQSQRHPWATADAALRLEWRLLGSASLELTAAVAAPLVRSRFVFENRVFHEVRPVVTRLGVGLSVRLP